MSPSAPPLFSSRLRQPNFKSLLHPRTKGAHDEAVPRDPDSKTRRTSSCLSPTSHTTDAHHLCGTSVHQSRARACTHGKHCSSCPEHAEEIQHAMQGTRQ